MRTFLLFVSLTMFIQYSFSQDASLTKDETINYINKLLQKSVDMEYYSDSKIQSISFAKSPKGIRYSYRAAGPTAYYFDAADEASFGNNTQCRERIYEFDPVYVKDITLSSGGNGAIKYCYISFINKSLVKEKMGSCRSEMKNGVLLFFFMAEQNDFSKLKKTLQHLVALSKAEDDPFG